MYGVQLGASDAEGRKIKSEDSVAAVQREQHNATSRLTKASHYGNDKRRQPRRTNSSAARAPTPPPPLAAPPSPPTPTPPSSPATSFTQSICPCWLRSLHVLHPCVIPGSTADHARSYERSVCTSAAARRDVGASRPAGSRRHFASRKDFNCNPSRPFSFRVGIY